MKFLEKIRDAAVALLLVAAAMLPPEGALAQVVTQLPVYININTVTDLGNGPQDLYAVQGNAWLFTSQGSGTGSTSGSSTNVTLTATPATPPCVGCAISGSGITAGTTVASFNGTTTLGLSTAMTVPASTPLAWGAACPSYSSLNGLPPTPNLALQASTTSYPMYTYARLCGYSNNGPGATILPFAIGAH
jgi:hypothetical protein